MILRKVNLKDPFKYETKEKIMFFLFTILPISLLSGPLIPEIIIIILSFFFILYGKNFCENICIKLLIFFLLLTFISTLISKYTYVDKVATKNLLKSFFHFRFLLLFLLVIFVLQNKKYQNIFYTTIKLILIFLFFDVYWQSYTGQDIFGNPKSHIGRLSGPYNKEYIIGGVILKFFFIYFIIFFEKNKFTLKYLLEFIFFVNGTLLSIMLSGERSTFFLFLLFILIFIILGLLSRPKSIFYLSLISFIIFFPIHSYNSKFIFSRVADVNYNSQQMDTKIKILDKVNNFLLSIKNSGYNAHYYSATTLFKNNIFFGVGQRNFRISCSEIANSEHVEIFIKKNNLDEDSFKQNLCTTHPHNMYLEILAETGLLGFISFLTFLIFFALRIIKSKKLYLLTPLIVTFFPFVTTGSFFNNFNSIFIFLILGVIYSNISNKNFFSA